MTTDFPARHSVEYLRDFPGPFPPRERQPVELEGRFGRVEMVYPGVVSLGSQTSSCCSFFNVGHRHPSPRLFFIKRRHQYQVLIFVNDLHGSLVVWSKNTSSLPVSETFKFIHWGGAVLIRSMLSRPSR